MVSSGALTHYKAFVQGVRISLPVIDQTLWKYLDLAYATRAADQLERFGDQLNRHVAAHIGDRAS